MKVRLSTIGGGLLALGLAAAPLLADAPDVWLTTKAKIALLTADGVSVTAVNVDSVNGNVTLHGKVRSEGEKAKAAIAVGTVDGVKSVQNLLQVVPDAVRPTLKVADDAIKSNLEASFKAEPALTNVKVASVNNGVALLSGKTRTLDEKLRAIEVAWAVQGVQRVASEIQTDARQ
jgi:hyperosmotically inducible protein